MSNHRDNPAQPGPDRRGFLQTAGLIGAGLALSGASHAPGRRRQLELTNTGPDRIPRKPFGRTKETVSVIGLGGYSLGAAPSLQEAIAIVHEAIDAGVNFFDNAWEYHDGKSEEWMGQALKGRRDKVFLMTKVCTHGRDKKVALRQLEESLKRLQTDHLDLWQVHECRLRQRPRAALRQRRGDRGAGRGQKGRQGALRRLHRPQAPGDPPQDALVRLPLR